MITKQTVNLGATLLGYRVSNGFDRCRRMSAFDPKRTRQLKVRNSKTFVLATAALSLCVSAVARADEIPPCRLPPHAESVPLLSEAPVPLQDAIRTDIGDLAKPGEDFNATDVVVDDRPSNRLIFIWHSAEIWIVATERGGIAYNDPIYAYRLERGKAILLETNIAFPNTVCITANRLWTNRRS